MELSYGRCQRPVGAVFLYYWQSFHSQINKRSTFRKKSYVASPLCGGRLHEAKPLRQRFY